MILRFVAVLMCFAVVSLGIPSPKVQEQKRKPNIIYVLSDDLGYGDLGCYGQTKIKTPNIDQMAKEGVRFTDYYSGSTVCAPARASLMTGLHQGHAYIRGNFTTVTASGNFQIGGRVSLRPQDETVAELLKRAGYRAGIVGKWGLGEPQTDGIPRHQGFDYFFGYLNQNHAHNYYTDHLWRNEEKVQIKPVAYTHDLFTNEALEFIRREKAGPFFLYLAYTIPHANDELAKETGNGMEVPTDSPYTNEPWTQTQKNYAAMITRMDGDIGRILCLLKELALDGDTIVFFTSDNGPPSNDAFNPSFFASTGVFRGVKRELHEGGIRVPMIVRWPGKIKAGHVSGHVWAGWDFLPTAAEIAGINRPKGIDGMSVLPVMTGRRQKEHQYLYWEAHEGDVAQAVRIGKWKGVRKGSDPVIRLYDLEKDISESMDVSEHNRQVVRRIDSIMKTARKDSFFWPIRNNSGASHAH